MIYPNQINTDSPESEKVLFKALAQLPDEDFTVFHNQEFVTDFMVRERIQYEIDFIIVDHRNGFFNSILILEVKGGNIKYNSLLDEWRQSGHVMTKSPVQQVTSATHSFMHRFNYLVKNVNVTWALAFTDVVVDYDVQLPTNLPRKRIFDINDIENIEECLIDYFDESSRYIGREGSPLTVFHKLKGALLVSCDLYKPLAKQFEENNQAFIKLTKQQSKIVKAIESNKNVVIQGPAGSGKTLIAYQKAIGYKQQGLKVLYLTFNKEIASHLRLRLREETNGEQFNILDETSQLEITNFHFWCKRIAEKNSTFQSQKSSDEYFNTYIPNKAMEVIRDDAGFPSYDVLIIDEGQDFRHNWLDLLNKVLKPEGRFMLFMDENQDIFQSFSGVPNRRDLTRLELTENCRNTKHIIHFLEEVLSINIESMDGSPEGEKVELKTVSSNEEQISFLNDKIFSLINKEHLQPADIIILVNNIDGINVLKDVKVIGGIPLKSTYDKSFGRSKDTIFYSYINTFKGLEAEVVFILDAQNVKIKKEFYTQASRAKNKLYITFLNNG